jgi:hypothetical protein
MSYFNKYLCLHSGVEFAILLKLVLQSYLNWLNDDFKKLTLSLNHFLNEVPLPYDQWNNEFNTEGTTEKGRTLYNSTEVSLQQKLMF